MPNTWNLSDIMSRATAALGNRADVALSTASFWANEGFRMVHNAVPTDFQELLAVSSTTSGERTIVKPAGFQEMLNLAISTSTGTTTSVLDDANGLRPLNVTEYDTLSTATGRPTHFLEYADWIELYPTPDSSYSLTLRYRSQPAAMLELTDTPSVATRYRYAVYLKTRELIADEIKDDAARNEAAVLYANYMTQTPSDRALKTREKHYTGASLPTEYP